jgi:hypothetical protein
MDTLKLIQTLLEKANLEEEMRHIKNRMQHPTWLEQPVKHDTPEWNNLPGKIVYLKPDPTVALFEAYQAADSLRTLYTEAMKENQRLQIEVCQQRAEALRMYDEHERRHAAERAKLYERENRLVSQLHMLQVEHEALWRAQRAINGEEA